MIRLLTISMMFIQNRRVIMKLKTTFKYNIYLFPMKSADIEISTAIFRFDYDGFR